MLTPEEVAREALAADITDAIAFDLGITAEDNPDLIEELSGVLWEHFSPELDLPDFYAEGVEY